MAPRLGHIEGISRICGYLKKVRKLHPRLLVNPSVPDHSRYPSIDHENWKEFYPDASEEIPVDHPPPKGASAYTTFWLDADLAYDKATCRSVTGIISMVNGSIYKTFSKRQATAYGSELVASRIATEQVIALRYLLRSLGVKVVGPTLMLGDNKSVVLQSTTPSSVLKKKHCAINYHRVREAIAAKVTKYVHIDSRRNLADCLTKPLPGNVLYGLVKPVLFANPGEVLWPGDNLILESDKGQGGHNLETDIPVKTGP